MVEYNETKGRPGAGFWAGIVVVLLATGYIVTSSMAESVHYYGVNEAVLDNALLGETMRLRGIVVDDSHFIRENSLDEHVFELTSEGEQIRVYFTGAVPDQFRDGASVIALGTLEDAESFNAESLTAQCPSRYEGEAPTSGGYEGVDTNQTGAPGDP
jgi:cytochrome c-type biogenesis protein CcmE